MGISKISQYLTDNSSERPLYSLTDVLSDIAATFVRVDGKICLSYYCLFQCNSLVFPSSSPRDLWDTDLWIKILERLNNVELTSYHIENLDKLDSSIRNSKFITHSDSLVYPSTSVLNILTSSINNGTLTSYKSNKLPTGFIDSFVDYGKLVELCIYGDSSRYSSEVSCSPGDAQKFKLMKSLEILYIRDTKIAESVVGELVCKDVLPSLRQFFCKERGYGIFDIINTNKCPHGLSCLKRFSWNSFDHQVHDPSYECNRISGVFGFSENLLCMLGVTNPSTMLSDLRAADRDATDRRVLVTLCGDLGFISKISLPICIAAALLKDQPWELKEMKIFSFDEDHFKYINYRPPGLRVGLTRLISCATEDTEVTLDDVYIGDLVDRIKSQGFDVYLNHVDELFYEEPDLYDYDPEDDDQWDPEVDYHP